MEQPVLADKTRFPTEEVIFSHIGRSRTLWALLFEYIHDNHPDFAEEWRYYLDGKSWLLKVTRKGKTIFWITLAGGSFRITFYFTDKADDALSKSSLPEELLRQYRDGKRFGKLRAFTIPFKNRKDVGHAKQLIEIKAGIK